MSEWVRAKERKLGSMRREVGFGGEARGRW